MRMLGQMQRTVNDHSKGLKSQTWWHTPVIPALSSLRQEDLKFKASLGYIVTPCTNGREEGE
jgi:hypothetical protein